MVTLEMHNNLINTINKMDDEMTQFAKRMKKKKQILLLKLVK